MIAELSEHMQDLYAEATHKRRQREAASSDG